jgi:ATP-binding cassette subfamily F protein uup
LAFEGDATWAEYPGGYSDMVDQRGRGVDEKVKAKVVGGKGKKSAQAAAPKPASGKLSYKDKFALETLPGEMDALQKDIEDIQAQMSNGDLYATDPDAFNALIAKMAQKQSQRDQAEEKWLELEMKREEIEGA